MVAVALGEAEGRNEHGVVQIFQRFLFEKIFQDALGFLVVHGEEALVVASVGGEHRLIAEQHIEEAEARNVAANDHHANRERGGQDQADGAPDGGPENGGEQNGHRRKSGVGAVERGLDKIGNQNFGDDEEPKGFERLDPAVKNRDGKKQRQNSADGRADVRQKAQEAD